VVETAFKDFLSLRKALYLESLGSYEESNQSAIDTLYEFIVQNEDKPSEGPDHLQAKITEILHPTQESTQLPENSVQLIRDLVDKINKEVHFINEKGILLFQFLFYGDPDHSGAGDSGGLGTLLRDLGTAISSNQGIAGVITVCAYDTSQAPYPYIPVRLPNERHALIQLPLDLGGSNKNGFLGFQARIEAGMDYFYEQLRLEEKSCKPLFHLRYLDSASLAVSRIAKKWGIPYALTLTPDPHRKINELRRQSPWEMNREERLDIFLRVLIGDVLIENTSAIIGIGKESINRSLIPYFPQLSDQENLLLKGIDEGIQISVNYETLALDALLVKKDCPHSIDGSVVSRPLILNVGRLNPTKGQLSLLQAWDQWELWKTHNLFLIGGDFETPSAIERTIIDSINEYLLERPYLKGKIRFQPSTSNTQIRGLEATLGQREWTDYPDVYVCSSLKEEFGISIIEAMSAGMVVLAPMLGGANQYLRHRVNGFLINTASSQGIGIDFTSYVYQFLSDKSVTAAIKTNASETIRQLYSLDAISKEFVSVYKKIMVSSND
jgi:glycosyltransferase involved in cell wall biosynthesis